MDKSKIAAVIPCYNCERTIQEVIKNTQRYCDNIFVIDDGSQDNSVKNVLYSGASVISLGRNLGTGKATREGLQLAIQKGFELFITLDADGSHLPSDIPNLVAAHINYEHDLTIGDRWTNAKLPDIPSSKRVANFFATYLTNIILSTSLTDVACGFRIFSLKAAKVTAISSTLDDFGFIYETINLVKQEKLIFSNSPVEVRYDANYLFATKINELNAFLFWCKKMSKEQEIKDKIHKIIELVENFKVLSLYLSRVGIYIIAHPIQNYSSYIFQLQNEFFVSTYPIIEI